MTENLIPFLLVIGKVLAVIFSKDQQLGCRGLRMKNGNSGLLRSRIPYSIAVMAMTIIICTSFFVYGKTVVNHLQATKLQWTAYTNEAAARTEALSRLHKHFGYGGFIHNFKNYIMRKDVARVDLIDKNIAEVINVIKDYRKLDLSDEEKRALNLFEGTVFIYMDRFELAKQLIADGIAREVVDQLVMAPDTDALVAIDALNVQVDRLVTEKEKITSEAFAETTKLISYGVLLIPVILCASGLILLLINYTARIRRDDREAQLMKALTTNMTEAVIVSDANGKIINTNNAASQMFGYSQEEFKMLDVDMLVSIKNRSHHRLQRKSHLQEMKPRKKGKGLVAVTKDGREIHILISLSFTEQGGDRYSVAIIRDVSQWKHTEDTLRDKNKKLEKLSLRDGLTEIPNRRFFDITYQQEWTRAQRSRRWLSIIILDLDYFKSYNDHYGHIKGDECLISVAQILSKGVQRSSDFVARFGGEEFVCVLPNAQYEDALVVAERLRKALESAAIPHEGEGKDAVITASFGVASVLPCNEMKREKLIEYADKELYKAKRRGRNQVSALTIA
ncbi:MAG: sensor domain-containing diguanylate cyclase [Porticoccus sp.]